MQRRAHLTVLLTVLVAGRGLSAQTPVELLGLKYEITSEHSGASFVARVMKVVKVRGRFRDWSSTIIYDPVHPERSSVTAIINAESIDTDSDFRDKHLKSPDFFDVANFPTIVFQSERILRRAGGFVAVGRFTMHGVTRQLRIPFTVVLPPHTTPETGEVEVAIAATLRLSQHEFGIAGTNKYNPSFIPAFNPISDSVDVTLEVDAARTGYKNKVFTGQQPPSIADTVSRALRASGADAAVRLYRILRADQPTAFDFGAGELNDLGYVLIRDGRPRDAIAIFTLNAEMFPKLSFPQVSLAEASLVAGDRASAIAFYERAIQLRPLNTSAAEMLRRLKTGT